MKEKFSMTIAIVAIITAVVAMIFSSMVFKTPGIRTTKVPVAQPLVTSLPDIKNDSSYNTIFNEKALDLTQTITVGGSQNTTPFNASQ